MRNVMGKKLPKALRSTKSLLAAVLGAAAFVTTSSSAEAATHTWKGVSPGTDTAPKDGAWNTAANWTGGAIGASDTLVFGGNTSYTSTDDISGSYKAALITLNNTSTNGITISGGTLGDSAMSINQDGSASVLFGTNVTLKGATVTLGGTGNGVLTFGGALAGSSNGQQLTISKSGSYTFILSGTATTFVTALNVTGGVFQIGNGGTTGSLDATTITNTATVSFNRSDSVTFANTINGTAGNVTQIGAGTTILTANNGYTGATTISAGTLQIGSGSTTGSLGTGTVTNTATLSFNRSNSMTVANTINGTGGNVSQIGAGTTILTASNGYTGGTTVTNGTLRVNNTSGSGTGTNAISVSNGATLGGSGTIGTTVTNTGVTVAAGGKLSPGAGDATAGVLTMSLSGTGKLDISSAVAASNTKALVFDLNGLAGGNTSDKIVISNGDANVANTSLAIGSSVLEWNDFDFRGWNNLATGQYVLIDTSETISGSLGSVVSGNLGWATGTIAFANSNQDIVLDLTVTPEPGSIGLLSTLALPALLKRRRRVL